MIEKRDVARALGKCNGYDYTHFPQASEVILMAWFEYFEDYPAVTGDDLLAAVKVYYRTPDRKVPQPADIGAIARQLRRDAADQETEEERDARALANDTRLGLDTSWYKTADELAAITDSEGRRKAIEAFARGVGRPISDALDNPLNRESSRETVAEKVARIRAEYPPQPLPPEDDPEVAENAVPAPKRVG